MLGVCCVGTAKRLESKGIENMASVSGGRRHGHLSEEENEREGDGVEETRRLKALGLQ